MKKYILFLFIAFSVAYESDAQDSLATVFFYKPGRVGQPFAEFVAFHGDRALGRVRQGKFFSYRCKPGDQTFSASNDAGAGSVTFTVEPGVWYFVSCDVVEGKPSFVKVDTKTAENDMYKINPAISAELASHLISTVKPVLIEGDSLAMIYFYRTGNISGFIISYNVRHNNNIIGRIDAKSAFAYRCKPGLQTFTANTEGEAALTMDIKAGQRYFVQCGVSTGALVGRPSFRQTSSSEGRRDLEKIDMNLANTIPLTISGSSEQNDTIRAITNLFQKRKKKGGTTRAVVFGVITVISLVGTLNYKPSTVTVKSGSSSQVIPVSSESPPAINYVLIGFGTIMTITGITQAAKYSPEAAQKVLSDYKEGKPLPLTIKQKFKKKDFK